MATITGYDTSYNGTYKDLGYLFSPGTNNIITGYDISYNGTLVDLGSIFASGYSNISTLYYTLQSGTYKDLGSFFCINPGLNAYTVISGTPPICYALSTSEFVLVFEANCEIQFLQDLTILTNDSYTQPSYIVNGGTVSSSKDGGSGGNSLNLNNTVSGFATTNTYLTVSLGGNVLGTNLTFVNDTSVTVNTYSSSYGTFYSGGSGGNGGQNSLAQYVGGGGGGAAGYAGNGTNGSNANGNTNTVGKGGAAASSNSSGYGNGANGKITTSSVAGGNGGGGIGYVLLTFQYFYQIISGTAPTYTYISSTSFSLAFTSNSVIQFLTPLSIVPSTDSSYNSYLIDGGQFYSGGAGPDGTGSAPANGGDGGDCLSLTNVSSVSITAATQLNVTSATLYFTYPNITIGTSDVSYGTLYTGGLGAAGQGQSDGGGGGGGAGPGGNGENGGSPYAYSGGKGGLGNPNGGAGSMGSEDDNTYGGDGGGGTSATYNGPGGTYVLLTFQLA
jgi:hypothetical protein